MNVYCARLVIAGVELWLCQDEECFLCLYPADADGPPGIRYCGDSSEETQVVISQSAMAALPFEVVRQEI